MSIYTNVDDVPNPILSFTTTKSNKLYTTQRKGKESKKKSQHMFFPTMPASSYLFFLLIFAIVTLSSPLVTATDHIVGANRGWNPGFNYTLWANNHTFYVGDLISFRYQKIQYNVFEVNQTGYDNCTTEGAVGNWSSGKDFIPLNKAKRYYFICGNGQCFNGMKVSVLVHPLPPPPTSAAIAADQSTSKSDAPLVLECGLHFLMVFFVLVLYGFGWI